MHQVHRPDTPDHTEEFHFDFDLDHGRVLGRTGGRGHSGPVLYDGPVLWRAQDCPQGTATLRIRRTQRRAVVDAWGSGLQEALASVPGLLGGADDPSRIVPRDPVVTRWAARFRNHRMTRTGTVWEHLVPTVIGQKVPGASAATSWQGVLDRWGRTPPGPVPAGLRLPPSSSLFAELVYHDMHDLNIERRRAETLIECARRAHRLEEAASMEGPASRRRLQSVSGVGPWTASIVCQLATGDPDSVIVGDYWLPSYVAWHLAGNPRADDRRMLDLLEPYRGQRARVQAWAKAAGAPPRRGPRLPLVDIAGH